MNKFELTAEEVVENVATAIFEYEGEVVIQIQGLDHVSMFEYFIFNKAMKQLGLDDCRYEETYHKTEGEQPIEVVTGNWMTATTVSKFESKFDFKVRTDYA